FHPSYALLSLTNFSHFESYRVPHLPPSFPTRRSPDLDTTQNLRPLACDRPQHATHHDANRHHHERSHADHGSRHKDVVVDKGQRSEEHTSELQSRENIVCRLLLEKKKA